MSNDYEAKKQERIECYAARAEKARAQANGLFEGARQVLAPIPPGQPILVGHHSEKMHRRTLARHDRMMDKACAAENRAEYWEQRAAAAESNTSISSDDPQVLEKLRAKLEQLTEAQEAMKKVNRAYKAEKLEELGYSAEQIAALDQRVKNGYSWEQQPYPSYLLKNNNANMRRIRQRIVGLEHRAEQKETRETINGVEIVQDVEAHRTLLYFPEVPDKEFRRFIKSKGFRWARSEGCWQRHLSEWALCCAREIAGEWVE